MSLKRDNDLAFEDAIEDDWSKDLDIAEVPIGNKPMLSLGLVIFVIVAAVFGRILFLNANGKYYEARAENNIAQSDDTPAPRGLIYDATGDVLAENKAAFAAVLDAQVFLSESPADQSSTLSDIGSILGLAPADVLSLVAQANAQDFAAMVVLAENLGPTALVDLQAADLSAVKIQSDFVRSYPDGPIFSSVVGYAGRVTADDLQADPMLENQDFIGKAGIEAYYDNALRGMPGVEVTYRNAQGGSLGEAQQSTPQIGSPLTLTIDGGLQAYFYNRLAAGLASLGRTIGVGIVMDPETGQVLSLVNLPGFDNNVFSETGHGAEIESLLTSSDKPLFNRAINGFYNPGSTIKPLDGVAALTEGVIDSTRDIFSPGYVLVPDPYDSSTPTKYLDWQYQGTVDLASALAQSSDVYFYIVGGGSPAATSPLLNNPLDYGITGLGSARLYDWWQKFGLGKPTGIDMPDEAPGFLPTPTWWKMKTGRPWLLGDTYNVSIGQGSLLLTPIQLIDYIGAIANGGTVYRPYLDASSTPQVREDLTSFLPEIEQVEVGMRDGVALPRGTAHTMDDLPFASCAKTGSAQIENNTEENALFVGYAPCDPATGALSVSGVVSTSKPIVVLVLIENSKQGSLNAVPIAKDVMNWYYENRMKE